MFILVCALLLMPPSYRETNGNNGDGKLQIVVKHRDGMLYGRWISHQWLVDSHDVLSIRHELQTYNIKMNGVEVELKATSLDEAFTKIKRWIRVFGGSM